MAFHTILLWSQLCATSMRTRISHQTSGSFFCGCWSPVFVACPLRRPRLGLASRRPNLVVVLAGHPFHCTFILLWLWLEPSLHLSAVEFLTCLHVERQQFALAQPMQLSAHAVFLQTTEVADAAFFMWYPMPIPNDACARKLTLAGRVFAP